MSNQHPTSQMFLEQKSAFPDRAAFTLTELLVVVAILALLAATQVPALTSPKSPARHTQCMNNCRQIGLATMLYKDENSDEFPLGNRIINGGSPPGGVLDPTGWPMQLLHYMGGYQNIEPRVYLCPSDSDTSTNGYAFRVHYQANRSLLRDLNDTDQPVRGSELRKAAQYFIFIEKSKTDFANVRSGSMGQILVGWNIPLSDGTFGYPQYVRHNWGMSSAAADGHVEWLRMPLYRPGSPPPVNMVELGDCASGVNPASTWQDTSTFGNHNGNRVKLYFRYSQGTSAGAVF